MSSVLRISVMALVVLVSCSCRRHDYRTQVISVPGMKNEQCAAIISNAVMNLSRLPSMGDCLASDPPLVFDFERRTVSVKYESMKLALKNLEHQIASHGFDANNTPAYTDAVAKLPPECR